MLVPENLPEYLSVRNGALYYKDVDLMHLVREFGSTLEISYTDTIREKILNFQKYMANAIAENSYPASFYYAYATKANYNAEVIISASNYADMLETSSPYDLELLKRIYNAGGLKKNLTIICNGTKTERYVESIEDMKLDGLRIIPTIETVEELDIFLKSDLEYELGLRINLGELNETLRDFSDRFGLIERDVDILSDRILKSQNIKLKLLHFHAGHIEGHEKFFISLVTTLISKFYKKLRLKHKDLEIIDIGGGLPVQYNLNFNFNYKSFADKLIKAVHNECKQINVLIPSIIGEFGRYTSADQGFNIAKVIYTKEYSEKNIWYTLSGSIMGRLPDAWALKQEFIILPINLWENDSKIVKLGGITCDPDDVYYHQQSKEGIPLPEIKEGQTLYLGIFGVGAYQQMISGVGGVHHCLIPEGCKLIIHKERGKLVYEVAAKIQSITKIIECLNYNNQERLKKYIEPEKQLINTYKKLGEYSLLVGEELDSKLYKKTFVLDKKVFADEIEADDDVKVEWFAKSHNTHIALVHNNTNSVIGYLSFFAITDEAKEKYINGEIEAINFREKDILTIKNPGFYNFYIWSTAVLPEMQGQQLVDPENENLHNKKVFRILNEALVDLIYQFAAKGCMFKSFTIDSVNLNTNELAESYNVKHVLKYKNSDFSIYTGEFNATCFEKSSNYKKLFKYYDEGDKSKRLSSTPLKDGFTVVADFDEHNEYYILWPQRRDNWRYDALPAQKKFSEIIKKISEYEKITIGTNNDAFAIVSNQFDDNKNVKVKIIKNDDSWMRDTGPISLKNAENVRRASIFDFNAYGGAIDEALYERWYNDKKIGLEVCKLARLDYYDYTNIILEGGAIVSDGEGTLITTRECVLNKNRNPKYDKEKVEEILKESLGIKKIIWLNRGIENDETNGHVDNICNFVRPAEVILAWTNDENDPQYEISKENLEILENSIDATGRKIKVHKLLLPSVQYIRKEEEDGRYIGEGGAQPRLEGNRMAASYVNMLISNKFVLVPTFDDPNDNLAIEQMKKIYPEKEIIPVYSREILLGGGNIHCITKHI